MRARRSAVASLALAAFALAACGGERVDANGRLVDRAAALDPAARQRVERYLDWLRVERAIDCRVVLVATDEPPAAAAERWFRELEVGADAEGRGVLLWLDVERHLARLEVGYALEGVLPDLSAGWILAGYVAPQARGDELAAGLEAAIEGIVDRLMPRLDALAASRASPGSGGAGAAAALDREPPPPADGFHEDLGPRPDPRAVRELELAMMRAGRYDPTVAIYDEVWRRTRPRGRWSPERLREIAARFDRPYEIATDGEHAVAWYPGEVALGPTLLRRGADGWIIDATAGARLIVYDYSNERWYLVDEPSPYVDLLCEVYRMRRGRLQGGRTAWWIAPEGG